MKKKVIIIGLDGATFDVIDPMIAEGRLPNLKRLIEDGASGPLRSTLHPNSFPGWSSCTTGTSEGMHGVYSPFIKESGQYAFRAMSGADIQTKTIWELLSERNRTVGVLNVPTTYPTVAVNGFLVTGMLTPTLSSDFTYPTTLREELLAKVPDYIIEPRRNNNKFERAAEFRACMDARMRAIDFLFEKFLAADFDFLMIVYSLLDRTQHDFWDDMDCNHHRHKSDSPHKNFIHEMYERADAAVGKLLAHLDENWTILVCSDHGFCASLYEVRVNEWLHQEGLLSYQNGLSWKAKQKFAALKARVESKIAVAVPAGWDNALDKKVERSRAVFEEIDWSQTKAFFGQDRGIWINLKGREAEGIVSESDYLNLREKIRAGLKKLTSPIDNRPVFEQVLTREEAFSGRYTETLPDIVVVTRDPRLVPLEGKSTEGIFLKSNTTSGAHAPYGIFIASGAGIRKNVKLENAHLRDLAPTALYAINEPLTEDMDGRALVEAFTPEANGERTLRRQGTSYKDGKHDNAFDEQEQDEIQERMRALGYIS
ncbi:MAG: alkaline phosphatase family protein [Blastocatellia bacterium]|nr:alkaline phosphatase family protein [Blastocatellia bacterium]